MDKKHDSVNDPQHYTKHPSGVECITIAEHMNFNVGNAVKYLWRADLKNGLEDLKKLVGILTEKLNDKINMADNFIKNFLTYAEGCETPELYDLWSSLATLSSVVSRRVWVNQGY